MKTLIVLAAVAALTGCAVAPAPSYYAAAPVSDPYQWHTVSVTPVGATTTTTSYSAPAYTSYSSPAYTTTVVTPVYAPAPVYYAPAPAYYYPPVTIGLDFVWGNWCCGHRHGWGRGHYRR